MRRVIMLFTVAAVMAVIMVALAASAFANCGDAECSVGAAGTGGEKSEGKAQGFRYEQPGEIFPTVTFTNTGNSDAGQLKVTGTVNDQPIEGQTAGTCRDEPSPSVRGRSAGVFGDSTGHEPVPTCNPEE